jgi:hypothetical protein
MLCSLFNNVTYYCCTPYGGLLTLLLDVDRRQHPQTRMRHAAAITQAQISSALLLSLRLTPPYTGGGAAAGAP